LSESYAQNVNGEAKKIWEEAVRQVTNEHVRGSTVYKSVVQYNSNVNRYKVYSLVILNPEVFKNAILDATERDQELELRVKKDEMLRRLDAGIAEYDAKYRK
jgi:PII-like signaling protein